MQNYLSSRARAIAPYTAGAQPQDLDVVKLNTNENPYPPSPAAISAYRNFDASRLRLYPHPEGGELRAAAAERAGLPESHVFCGNGSDEVLGFAFLAFFNGDVVFPDVTYSFYPVWAALYDISYTLLPLRDDFTIPVDTLRTQGGVVLANPNAPTGIALPLADVETVLKNNPHCVVIVDEAYCAFGAQSADCLVPKYPNLLVGAHAVQIARAGRAARGLRAGPAAPRGRPHAHQGLLQLVPAGRGSAAHGCRRLRDTRYYEAITDTIIATRERTAQRLQGLGFNVLPSSTNFVFAAKKGADASRLKACWRKTTSTCATLARRAYRSTCASASARMHRWTACLRASPISPG